MMSSRYYLAYQLVIRSSLPVPGGILLPQVDPRVAEPVDVEVLEGPIAADSSAPTAGPYRIDGDRLIFEAPNTARYLCTDREVTVERAKGATDSELAGYLVATALPACLWMRGEIVLHAAAGWLPSAKGAFAIAGISGSGKSTVLEQLVCMGARIVADDSLCVRITASGIEVSGLGAGYFLGSDPRSFHGLAPERQLEVAPLAGLAILALPRSASSSGFHRLGGVSALEALLDNRHRPRIPALLGTSSAHLGTLAAIARQLPIYAWQRSQGAFVLDPAELEFLAGH